MKQQDRDQGVYLNDSMKKAGFPCTMWRRKKCGKLSLFLASEVMKQIFKVFADATLTQITILYNVQSIVELE